jgi:nucleotide-binding universal stress UspA family protein
MDHELQRQMAAFEAARIARPIQLVRPSLKRILVARDGSNQDPPALVLAREIAKRHSSEVGEWNGKVSELAHEAILAACEAADLLVIPSPFGADHTAVGAYTLSTTLDIVLARGHTPVLCIRQPELAVTKSLDAPLVVLDVHRERKSEATAMALALTAPGGEVALLAVVDPTQPQEREEILGRWLDPAQIEEADLTALHGARTAALTAALQKESSARGVLAKVMVRTGAVIDVALEQARQRAGILVVGLDRRAGSPAAKTARELILRSKLPVLLV